MQDSSERASSGALTLADLEVVIDILDTYLRILSPPASR